MKFYFIYLGIKNAPLPQKKFSSLFQRPNETPKKQYTTTKGYKIKKKLLYIRDKKVEKFNYSIDNLELKTNIQNFDMMKRQLLNLGNLLY